MKYSLMILGLAITASSFGQFVEGGGAHNSKATAQAFTLSSGQFIDGSISVGGESDYYRVNLAAQAPGIYRNQLVTSRRAGATVTPNARLRGLAVSGGVIGTTDVGTQFQSFVGANSDALLQFYSFGLATSVYQQVTSASVTNYKATLTQNLITPTVISGAFAPGSYSLTANGVDGTDEVDTEVVLYDSNFNIVAQNDDTSSLVLASSLSASLVAGTYYVAISDWDVTTNRAPDINDGNQGGDVMDFAGVLVNSSTALTGFNQPTIDLGFSLTDPSGNTQVAGTKTERFGMSFYQFTVNPVPEPASMIALGLGAVGLLRRKKK